MCNMTRRRTLCSVMLIGLLTSAGSFVQADQNDLLRAMALTGQNNHGWQVLSAHYKDILEDTGLFRGGRGDQSAERGRHEWVQPRLREL